MSEPYIEVGGIRWTAKEIASVIATLAQTQSALAQMTERMHAIERQITALAAWPATSKRVQ